MSVMFGSKKKRDYKKEKLQVKQLMDEVRRGNKQSSAKLQQLMENDWRYKAAFEDLMQTEFKIDKA